MENFGDSPAFYSKRKKIWLLCLFHLNGIVKTNPSGKMTYGNHCCMIEAVEFTIYKRLISLVVVF